ncbi:MAG: hypothetical protein II736_01100, partial [Clostridia bacterium]|nr:hypothetical protein [Clostridia bacterium]
RTRQVVVPGAVPGNVENARKMTSFLDRSHGLLQRGSVFINGFNIGRYWELGPRTSLYVPAPLLRRGGNVVEIFELEKPGTDSVGFITEDER